MKLVGKVTNATLSKRSYDLWRCQRRIELWQMTRWPREIIHGHGGEPSQQCVSRSETHRRGPVEPTPLSSGAAPPFSRSRVPFIAGFYHQSLVIDTSSSLSECQVHVKPGGTHDHESSSGRPTASGGTTSGSWHSASIRCHPRAPYIRADTPIATTPTSATATLTSARVRRLTRSGDIPPLCTLTGRAASRPCADRHLAPHR